MKNLHQQITSIFTAAGKVSVAKQEVHSGLLLAALKVDVIFVLIS